MSKVPTYIINNIILIVLSAPALYLLIFALAILIFGTGMFTLLLPVTIAFIVGGIVLGLRSAKKVRYMAASGQPEEGLRYSKRVHKYFLGVFIITWILCILSAIYIPSYTAYRSRGYDAVSRNDLKNFYFAAERYFQKNPDGTIDVESAKQYSFKPSPGVKLEIQKGQRMNFTATASHPGGTERYLVNNNGEIVEQKMPDR